MSHHIQNLSHTGMPSDASLLSKQKEASRPSLHEDQRGAIMLIGLVVSCFLIGAVWSLMGLGDAIVFRDRMQEATDNTAFSNTVVHAKGMNFIAMLNLVMMALAGVWMLLGVVRDVLAILAEICMCIIYCLATAFQGLYNAADKMNTVWLKYGKMMKGIDTALGNLEYATAKITPFLSIGAGIGVSQKYDKYIISVSSSVLSGGNSNSNNSNNSENPDNDPNVANALSTSAAFSSDNNNNNMDFGSAISLGGGGGGGGGGGSDDDPAGRKEKKIGLPVVKTAPQTLCVAVFGKLGQAIGDTGKIGEKMGNDSDSFLTRRYCGDWLTSPVVGIGLHIFYMLEMPEDDFQDWFTEVSNKGPKNMWVKAHNGNDWMQTWAMAPVQHDDTKQNFVGFANRKFQEQNEKKFTVYTAESEMYFDCKEGWEHDECNRSNESDWSGATYSLRWRTRLVKVRSTNNLGRMAVMMQFAVDNLVNGGAINQITQQMGSFGQLTQGVQGGMNTASQFGESAQSGDTSILAGF